MSGKQAETMVYIEGHPNRGRQNTVDRRKEEAQGKISSMKTSKTFLECFHLRNVTCSSIRLCAYMTTPLYQNLFWGVSPKAPENKGSSSRSHICVVLCNTTWCSLKWMDDHVILGRPERSNALINRGGSQAEDPLTAICPNKAFGKGSTRWASLF